MYSKWVRRAAFTDLVAEYLLGLMPGLLFAAVYMILTKYVQCQNKVIPPLLSSIFGNGVNAAAHYVLIYQMKMGTLGSAIARTIGYLAQAASLLSYIICSKMYKRTWNGFRIEMWHDWGIWFRLATLWTALIVVFTSCSVNGVILALLRDYIPRIFSKDPDVIASAAQIFPSLIIFHFFGGIVGGVCGVIRGVGLQKVGAIVCCVCMYCVGGPIGLSLLLATPLGVSGFWWGLSIASVLEVIIYTIVCSRINWEKQCEKIRDRYLIVVALISGRRFVGKPGYNIIVEAKFDKEILTSDPVPHSEEPKFEQELAWELDRQALRQHRIKRSSIKLQLFSIDPLTPVKEPIGYLVLDVRSASNKKVFKWCQVLHSKYKTCPYIYCGIYVDSDGREVVLSAPTSQQTMGLECLQVKPKRCLTAKAGESIQYFQIGPSNFAQEDFLFSIDILSVQNVTSLLLTDTVLPEAELCPFKVTLNVLGVDLEGSEFSDPVFASFIEDHFAFKLRSAVDFLRAYFSKEGQLTVRIKCGDQVLAVSNFILSDLLQQVDHAFLKPVSSQETIWFYPVNTEKQSTVSGPGDGSDAAFAVLRFGLQRDSAKAVVSRPLTSCDETVTLSSRPQHLDDNDLLPASNTEANALMQLAFPFLQAPTEDILFDLDLAVANLTTNCEPPATATTAMSPIPPTPVPLQSASRSPPPTVPEPVHRFCYSIELKALQATNPLPENCLVYARYVYPLFGSRSPIMTLPPVALPGTDETVLPQGFCTFELAAEPTEALLFTKMAVRVALED
nr:unnamed protein product [Spirometra erinaceieuropaei]